MNNLFNLFFYTLFYYQLDSLLIHFVYNKYELFKEDPLIFYPVIQTANIFILSIFILFTTYLLLFSQIKNFNIYSLSLIYIKYVSETVINNNIIGIYQYEFRRTVMWLFTTPLILKLYADMNHLTLIQINAYYHIFSNVLHIVLYPFRKTYYNTYILIGLSVTEGYFIYKLFDFKQQKYTKFIIYVWGLFSFITFIELTSLINIHDIQICYLLSDMIAKLTTMLIINDYEEQIHFIKNNIDLQSISLLAIVKKSISQFEMTNHMTTNCKTLIRQLDDILLSYIPTDKTTLKLQLLKKILPLELEEQYLSQSPNYKQYNFICVLFTDIVSYTELAKKYDETIIYKLLNEIYIRFDDIVIRYANLQKIETVGDAYMVVGDIYNNDTKNNVKNIILLAFDFLQEIKLIKTPDNKPLQLRIGINIGKVVVGILGVEIPRLCVVGNTVNVASRLQSTADVDTIQISRHIYEIAEAIDFDIEFDYVMKENVFLKNIGSVTTYNIMPDLTLSTTE